MLGSLKPLASLVPLAYLGGDEPTPPAKRYYFAPLAATIADDGGSPSSRRFAPLAAEVRPPTG